MPFDPVNMFNFNKPRNQPSPYPFPTTYILAVSSLISSLITFIILAYFSYYLRMDNMTVPVQFVFVRRPFSYFFLRPYSKINKRSHTNNAQLLVASLVSILTVTFTTSTHIFRTMTPRTSMIINGLAFILWIIGLSIITAKIGSMVLGHTCAMPMWATEMGVMVCRIYKALYSFIVIGTASLGASVILDISVSNEVSKRGMYREMKDEGKAGGMAEPSPGLRRGFYTNVDMKDSPDLGVRGAEFDADTRYDGVDDDTAKLVSRKPDLSDRMPKL